MLPLLYRANVGALSLPLAGPRHQHEYRAFERDPLPDGMLFLPGVIDTTTNVVEHPEVVADRIDRAASTSAAARAGHRLDGLRLRDLRGVGERRRERRVGQARRARRGGRHRQRAPAGRRP